MDDVPGGYGLDLAHLHLRRLHRGVSELILTLPLQTHGFVIKHPRVLFVGVYEWHDLRRTRFSVVVRG